MRLEKAWYEASPYLFAATGAAASLYEPGSLLLEASGLLLFVLAVTIVGLRWASRRESISR